MIQVVLTTNLQKKLKSKLSLEASNLFELLQKMDELQKDFSKQILTSDKNIHQHVNVFIDGQMVKKTNINVPLKKGQTVYFVQALSGG